ncbi:DUF4158 domain-containing protein [Nocardia pseudovaccinii]|uniref:DUF4158 domain-containing protein n=1 Tax=Nocardia pseudovaccinii TaxID=189540 RepID=UPI003D905C11
MELERFCYLDGEDRKLVEGRRGDYNRLGFALQVVTVRHPPDHARPGRCRLDSAAAFRRRPVRTSRGCAPRYDSTAVRTGCVGSWPGSPASLGTVLRVRPILDRSVEKRRPCPADQRPVPGSTPLPSPTATSACLFVNGLLSSSRRASRGNVWTTLGGER